MQHSVTFYIDPDITQSVQAAVDLLNDRAVNFNWQGYSPGPVFVRKTSSGDDGIGWMCMKGINGIYHQSKCMMTDIPEDAIKLELLPDEKKTYPNEYVIPKAISHSVTTSLNMLNTHPERLNGWLREEWGKVKVYMWSRHRNQWHQAPPGESTQYGAAFSCDQPPESAIVFQEVHPNEYVIPKAISRSVRTSLQMINTHPEHLHDWPREEWGKMKVYMWSDNRNHWFQAPPGQFKQYGNAFSCDPPPASAVQFQLTKKRALVTSLEDDEAQRVAKRLKKSTGELKILAWLNDKFPFQDHPELNTWHTSMGNTVAKTGPSLTYSRKDQDMNLLLPLKQFKREMIRIGLPPESFDVESHKHATYYWINEAGQEFIKSIYDMDESFKQVLIEVNRGRRGESDSALAHAGGSGLYDPNMMEHIRELLIVTPQSEKGKRSADASA
jgi:hypothetical protein